MSRTSTRTRSATHTVAVGGNLVAASRVFARAVVEAVTFDDAPASGVRMVSAGFNVVQLVNEVARSVTGGAKGTGLVFFMDSATGELVVIPVPPSQTVTVPVGPSETTVPVVTAEQLVPVGSDGIIVLVPSRRIIVSIN